MMEKYYVCPECGFKQRSEAEETIVCRRCGRSYKRRKAKVEEKKPDEEKGTDFFKYEEE